MRIDLFMKATNIVKRRSIAKDMIEHKAVLINSQTCKPSREVNVGDEIKLVFLDDNAQKYEVLEIPTTKTTPKSDKQRFVKQL